MKKILVPLDGSELALQILPYVRMLAGTLSAEVHLMHVVSHPHHAHLLDPYASVVYNDEVIIDLWKRDAQLCTLLRQQAESYLDAAAAELRQDGLDVYTDVHFGLPANCIVHTAEDMGMDMIAMVTHGYSGLRRWTLGSITDKVVHATHTPVFVVRGQDNLVLEQPPTIKHILVPLDGSPFARQALPVAQELATHAGADIRLLHAVASVDDYPALVRVSAASEPFTDALRERRKWAVQELTLVAQDVYHAGVVASTHVVTGRPAGMIIEEAVQQRSDLIVMATHGYTGLLRWALGSVADKVLHATTTPLLLVRAQDPEQ